MTASLVILCAALVVSLLAGCGFQPGGQQLAFLRNGQLWVVNPDGSNARELFKTDVAGFAWSPDHHMLLFRYGSHAVDLAGALPIGTSAGAPDAISELDVVSISGGNPIPISPVTQGIVRSDGWWDTTGNRFLYREYPFSASASVTPLYIDSQNDQPVGIARKTLLDAASLPALNDDGTQVAVIDPVGAVRLGTPGDTGAIVASGALLTLPGTSRPARVLWRPGHDALLYASATSSQSNTVTLMLRDLANGRIQPLLQVSNLLDAAFSPDGSLLLTRTTASFQVWPVTTSGSAPTMPRFSLPESDPLALPWWSPNGHELLIQDANGWRLVNAQTGATQTLLTYATPLTEPAIGAGTLWRPAASSPWSPDGTQFVFVSSGAARWQGQPLPTPKHGATGLYVASVSDAGAASSPTLIDSNADSFPGWSAANPSSAFLAPA